MKTHDNRIRGRQCFWLERKSIEVGGWACRIRKSRVGIQMLLVSLLVGFAVPSTQGAESPLCARIDQRQGLGPFDYRKRHILKKQLNVVENHHFTPTVQRGALRGNSKNSRRGDLDYTLRAFPNHAPALYLLAVFEHEVAIRRPEEFRNMQGSADYSPPSCYFRRALRFAPGDPNVHNAYGRFLTGVEKYAEAIVEFERALKLAPKSAAAHYNLGLALYAAKKYTESARVAREAYRLGYKRGELRDRLKRTGHW